MAEHLKSPALRPARMDRSLGQIHIQKHHHHLKKKEKNTNMI
jgi:hypothetical protein